jgi:hypothetical protein
MARRTSQTSSKAGSTAELDRFLKAHPQTLQIDAFLLFPGRDRRRP